MENDAQSCIVWSVRMFYRPRARATFVRIKAHDLIVAVFLSKEDERVTTRRRSRIRRSISSSALPSMIEDRILFLPKKALELLWGVWNYSRRAQSFFFGGKVYGEPNLVLDRKKWNIDRERRTRSNWLVGEGKVHGQLKKSTAQIKMMARMRFEKLKTKGRVKFVSMEN